ncbi:fungal hydrophobin [Pleurotus eryngii]|uniref:Hydrophobin n=1 Tax=Pleurotus eryngii TaxID=5323 RepID=A0A9P5ZV29_PLEER|nr:fungal hydrophobin [Pleurotus eryngii]
MYSQSMVLLAAAFASFVAASPMALHGANSCSTGPVHCCNSVEHHTQPHVNTLLRGSGLLGLDIETLVGNIGLDCSPIGLSSTDCTAQTVCCDDVTFDGSVAVGCTPVNLSVL